MHYLFENDVIELIRLLVGTYGNYNNDIKKASGLFVQLSDSYYRKFCSFEFFEVGLFFVAPCGTIFV